jgi:hypothetical protein
VKEKARGGLGFGFLQGKNKAFLLKWLWSLQDQNLDGWQEMVTKKYSPSFENSLLVFASSLSNIWQGIYSTINCNDEFQLTMKSALRFKVGNGRNIYFWLD